MLKLTVAVLAFALAGTASAAGWRKLQIDASSEEAFAQSLEVFKDKLPRSRWYAFDHMVGHIWLQETLAAAREYTRDDYLRQLDGLTYNEVGRVLDPTGELEQQYRAAYYQSRLFAYHTPPDRYRLSETGTFNRSFLPGNETRGGTDLVGVPGQK